MNNTTCTPNIHHYFLRIKELVLPCISVPHRYLSIQYEQSLIVQDLQFLYNCSGNMWSSVIKQQIFILFTNLVRIFLFLYIVSSWMRYLSAFISNSFTTFQKWNVNNIACTPSNSHHYLLCMKDWFLHAFRGLISIYVLCRNKAVIVHLCDVYTLFKTGAFLLLEKKVLSSNRLIRFCHSEPAYPTFWISQVRPASRKQSNNVWIIVLSGPSQFDKDQATGVSK